MHPPKPSHTNRKATRPCSNIELIKSNAGSLLVDVTGTGMAFADWLDSIGIKSVRVIVRKHGIERK